MSREHHDTRAEFWSTGNGISRRQAARLGLAAAVGVLGAPAVLRAREPDSKPAAAKPVAAGPLFTISLAQWSLHKTLFSKSLDHLDFPKAAKDDYGIDAVEYVNAFFKTASAEYVNELKKRCDDLAVTSLLIMCDGEGALGDPTETARIKAVENHYKWVEAAKLLGCHSIRVNAQSEGSFVEQQDRAADGLRRLCAFGDAHGINVIVENHGGLSSNGEWLAGVMKKVAHPRVGTLPDFGNFYEYDRYKGVADLMPFAKGVSAKSYDFAEKDATSPDGAPVRAGDETKIDYRRMLKLVLDAGYRGRIGIEYEGGRLPEPEGIRATKRLLERVRDEMAAPAK